MFIQMSYFSMWLIILKKGKENPKLNELNDFEQLLYLFENNENDAILKTKERLVKVFMEKYKEIQKNEKVFYKYHVLCKGYVFFNICCIYKWFEKSFSSN